VQDLGVTINACVERKREERDWREIGERGVEQKKSAQTKVSGERTLQAAACERTTNQKKKN